MLGFMKRESRAVWEERVERWRRSGQSAHEFSAQMGFNAWTLRKWSDRLRRERAADAAVREQGAAAARQPTAARRARASQSAVAPLAFVEVLASSASASAPGQLLEIVLRSGVIVRVPDRFEPQALGRVLAALGSR